ncbi:hypothetical protein J4405_02800, partial [Candidatus Woesearchaeota archaeon]|nr:hypothetical protein [Candidatus Woesearchaeota archaeon]
LKMKKILLFFALFLVCVSLVNADIGVSFDKTNYNLGDTVKSTVSGCTANDVATLIVSSPNSFEGNTILWIDQITYASTNNLFSFKLGNSFTNNVKYNVKIGCSGSTKDSSFCVGNCLSGGTNPPAPPGGSPGGSNNNNRRSTDNSAPPLLTGQTDLNDGNADGSNDNTGQENADEKFTEEREANYLIWIIFFVVLLIVIGVAIFFIVKYWNKGKKDGNDKLGDYIKQSLKRGDSKEIIKKNLINAGWPERTVDDAIKKV